MRKRNLILASAVMAVISLTACGGKEGGIIETNATITVPTLGTPEPYKETEAQTKANIEDTWTKMVSLDGFSYTYPSDWMMTKSLTSQELVWSGNAADYVEVSITRDFLNTFTLDTYVNKLIKDYSSDSMVNSPMKYKVDKTAESVKVLGYAGKTFKLQLVDKDLGNMTYEYTLWADSQYIYTAYVLYSEDSKKDTIELGRKILNTVKFKKKADI